MQNQILKKDLKRKLSKITARIKLCFFAVLCRRDSAAGIAAGYVLDDRGVGVPVPAGARCYSSPRRPDQPSSYSMSTGAAPSTDLKQTLVPQSRIRGSVLNHLSTVTFLLQFL